MGALHEGHLSLVHAARAECDTVVLSIFVNPTQFNDATDLSAYPRTEAADLARAADAGVDIAFVPAASEMYPSGHVTTVRVSGRITESFEAVGRGQGHFDGMATIVTKLLLAVQPDLAYFGAKDAQQAVVVRRLIEDLRLTVGLRVCETSRDRDGLARSSRNSRLSPEERQRALGLFRALSAAKSAFDGGEQRAATLLQAAQSVLDDHGVQAEYLAIADSATLEELQCVDRSALILIAAHIGRTRLIDNLELIPGEF
jgi:pantoate--beta-alanine ligase